MSSLPQAMGNALISCIHAAHSWRLLMKQDMEKFQEMCEDGLLGTGDYVIFKDWSAIARSKDGYIRIRDGLVLEGEVQEMNDEDNFYDEEPYKARVCEFFLAYHQMRAYCLWLSFHPTNLEHYCKFEVSLEWVMFLLAC
jgi:hypothetical protein